MTDPDAPRYTESQIGVGLTNVQDIQVQLLQEEEAPEVVPRTHGLRPMPQWATQVRRRQAVSHV